MFLRFRFLHYCLFTLFCTLLVLLVSSEKNHPVEIELTTVIENDIEDDSTRWLNETGTILTKTKEENEDTVKYSIEVSLPTAQKTISCSISEVEFLIVEVGDLILTHYVFETNSKEILFDQLIRENDGHLSLIQNKPIVVLDAGHGGFDSGEGSNDLWIEKEMNLKITLKLRDLLEDRGIHVVLTRSEDEFISLYKRCEISNYLKPDLFISNHLNRMNGVIHGVEIIYNQRADSDFAKTLAESISSSTGQSIFRVYNRRSEQFSNMDYYFVHQYNEAPSYIIEYGFADAKDDMVLISENWESMVIGVADTIAETLILEETK